VKIQIMSDVHLEFGALNAHKVEDADTLFLAGDIIVAAYLRKDRTDKDARKQKAVYDQFFNEFAAQFNQVFMVPGNHEYYGSNVDEAMQDMLEYFQYKNVVLMDNEVFPLTDTHALFAGTFWTDFKNDDYFVKYKGQQGMTDYHVIYNRRGLKLTPNEVLQWNKEARQALRNALDTTERKLVVMTHHGLMFPPALERGPSMDGTDFDFLYYNTGLEEWILNEGKVAAVIHGHTHDTYNYNYNGVQVIVNPRGYHKYRVNEEFVDGFVLEIK
jgi:predicted phosphodiesterase